MLNALANRRMPVVLMALLVSGFAFPHSEMLPRQGQESSNKGTREALSPSDLMRLRPAVLPDLTKLLQQLDGESPNAADLEQEFLNCRFRPLQLEHLGSAVLVEDVGSGTNSSMLNIYLRTGNSYRRVIAASGFGPMVLAHAGSPPDIVFGWTEGASRAVLWRWRYSGGKYAVDACDDESSPDMICKGPKAPRKTFPNPYTDAKTENVEETIGPPETGKEILAQEK